MRCPQVGGWQAWAWAGVMFSAQNSHGEAAVPMVRFALPAPALRPLVTTYYQVETAGPLIDHLHPEWGNMRFVTSGQWRLLRPGQPPADGLSAGLYGPSDRTAQVICDGPGALVGVGLTALGWRRLIGTPAHLMANAARPLDAVWAEPALALWTAIRDSGWEALPGLIDAALLARASRPAPGDALVEQVQQALVDGNIDTVHDFAAGLGLTERTLSRLCRRVFGFAPKRLLRRQRFLRTLAEIGDRLDQPLSQLLDGGYYDQSHFIREFKGYMAMAPLAYFHSPRQMMRRAAAERLRAAGAAVQGLHRSA